MKYVSDRLIAPELTPDRLGYAIPVPQYHRAAVGLFPGTRLFVVPLQATRDLIVTSIHPDKWGDLWRLKAALLDVPGAARSVVKALVEEQVNILIEEGLSDYGDNGQLTHGLFLILDLARYASDIDRGTEYRNSVDRPGYRPNHLLSKVASSAVGFIKTTRAEDNWALSLERMDFFYRHKGMRKEVAQMTNLYGRSLVIDRRVISEVCGGLEAPDVLACHILSDTEEKYLKIRFLDPKRQYGLVKIVHRERVGAILSFMDVLKAAEVNIANSYSRLAKIDETAVWYAFVEFGRESRMVTLESILRDLAALDAVDSVGLTSSFGFQGSVRASLVAAGIPKYVDEYVAPRVGGDPSRSNGASSGASAKSGAVNVSIREAQSNVEESLSLNPIYRRHKWAAKPDVAFLAVPFDDSMTKFYERWVKEPIASAGLRPLRLDDIRPIPEDSSMLDIIHEYVMSSRLIVADVTGYNGNVLFEVGLACAVGKPVILLCEKSWFDKNRALFDLSTRRHVLYQLADAPGLRDAVEVEVAAILRLSGSYESRVAAG